MKRNIVILFVYITSSFALADDQASSPFFIENSQVITYKSKLLKRSYNIYIKSPRSFAEDKDEYYPILFLNDGNYSFPLASSLSRQMVGFGKIEDMLIVGISYSNEVSWQISRTRDYTPTYAPNEKNYHSAEARKHSGGSGAYLEFIQKELFPFLHANYRADLNRKIYAGHSFGGLFGGYVLKTTPNAFDYYIISDPSFWYDNQSIFNIKQKIPKENSAEIQALIVSANPYPEREESGTLKMKENAQRFASELQSELGNKIKARHLVFDDEIHESLFPISLSRGLRDYLGKE